MLTYADVYADRDERFRRAQEMVRREARRVC
jgi:hypothetical protein